MQYGYWQENSTRVTSQTDSGDTGLRFDVDPDGVPRRAMGGYNSDSTNNGGNGPPSYASSATTGQTVYGLPMVTGNYSSRPTILHRPFLSVAELGYCFRDTPWGDLNFSFPESGDSALLDVFCINENYDPNALTAGRVNFNSRQAPVMQALLAGTLLDKDDPGNPMLSQAMASALASQLVSRTINATNSSLMGPLTNRGDLVGTSAWAGDTTGTTAGSKLSSTLPASFALSTYYGGFSADIGTLAAVDGTAVAMIPRQREAAMRALADSGNARTWNLLIDVVAQSGHYPSNASKLSNFTVEGEKRYWLHVAIDRLTGRVVDKQLELVTE